MDLMNASMESKTDFKLPEGATIIKKSYTVRVEEIENGFIVSKNYDIKYSMGEGTDTLYDYHTKKWFVKENPMEIDVPEEEDKSLADKFE